MYDSTRKVFKSKRQYKTN